MNPQEKRILVFDLEVAAYDFESHYDDETKEYLTKYAKDDEDRERIIESLVFTPFTSFLVAIGVFDYHKKEGEVWMNSDEKINLQPDPELLEKGKSMVYSYGTEKEIIQKFWDKLRKERYNLFVTFNGREFDCPYIMLRSVLHEIKPSYNLMSGTDFNIKGYHIDLMKEFTFNKHSPTGARRKFSLDFYCRQFGIPSPKSKGVTGDMVSELYRNREYQKIADYCMGDVVATANLFYYWNKYLDFN